MQSKRKREDESSEDESEGSKRPRAGSTSALPSQDTDDAEKNTALRKLFGRISSMELNGQQAESSDEESLDECEDPLLDSIPVDMDPEQLGFLVCAQETLRFLHMRGMSVEHPMFARLRSRFLRGIHEMGLA